MSDLLSFLPGDIPGLLLRGSPAHYHNDALRLIGRGLVVDPEDDIDAAEMPLLLPWYGRIDGETNPGQQELNQIAPGCGVLPGVGYRVAPSLLLALDLTDPTGRAHAAWWARDRLHMITDYGEWSAAQHRLSRAERGDDMTPTQIDTFARLCLRLAGRAP